MPSTSPSWSTLVNFPLAFRQATIAAARTGPTPGRVSNCSTVALLRLISAVGAPLAGRGVELGGAGPARPGTPRAPQTRRLPFDGPHPDHDLLAVITLPSHVEPAGVGAVGAS